MQSTYVLCNFEGSRYPRRGTGVLLRRFMGSVALGQFSTTTVNR